MKPVDADSPFYAALLKLSAADQGQAAQDIVVYLEVRLDFIERLALTTHFDSRKTPPVQEPDDTARELEARIDLNERQMQETLELAMRNDSVQHAAHLSEMETICANLRTIVQQIADEMTGRRLRQI